MFLSEVLINTRNALGRQDLASPYELHRTLSSGFPDGGRPRILFRQEIGAPRVMMLTLEEPSFDKALASGRLLFVRSKLFTPAISNGQQLRFRLLANPTRKAREGGRSALTEPAEQMQWLARKGEQHGYRLLSAHIVRDEVWRTARPEGRPMTHVAIDFHGYLEVSDGDALMLALRSGIGSAKAFGFGMLCVAR